jgi:biofilm PGA synthesis N-glycosyltransferase PgaC
MLLLYIVAFLFLLYARLMFWYWLSWKKLETFQPTMAGTTKISVVIAARNEEENIGALLTSLQQQTYPRELFEIIIVDDDSTDATAEKVKLFPGIRLLQSAGSNNRAFKKQAISTGIGEATGELIVTTDADCILPPRWLETISAFYKEKKLAAIAGPVLIETNGGLLEDFQCMDFLTLQGVTGASMQNGSMTMANGANLAYRKEAFEQVGGFAGIDQIASGDDMLLLYKISKAFPGQVGYLLAPDAIVSTAAMPTLKQFFQQRLRWAGKSLHYDDKRIFPILVLVYLLNLGVLSLLIAGFFDHRYWIFFAAAWIMKTIVELPFYLSVASFFNKLRTVPLFFFMQPIHILYTVIVGAASQFGSYEWKGRKLK